MAEVKDIRNIVVLGHSSCGKTSLSDAILFNADIVSRQGKVDDGTSVLDYSDEEIDRKISISTSLAQFAFEGKQINLLDTPGYVDFIGEPISALRAADIALVVVDGIEKVQFGTIKMVKEADQVGLSKIVFINKLDKENADYDQVIENLKAIAKGLTPVTIPVKESQKLIGVINIFENNFYSAKDGKVQKSDIPENLKSNASNYRTKMIEAIAETDDALTEKYLNKGALSEEEIKSGFIKGIGSGAIVPVFAGSAILNTGVHSLLEFIVNSAPSPLDRKPVKVKLDGKDEQVECKVDPSSGLKAFIFKTQTEAHIGQLNFVRVFSGSMNTGEEIYNVTKNSSEKIGQMYNLFGKERKEVKSISAGDIAVIVKLKGTSVGDTLCRSKEKVLFPKINFPTPLLEIAIIPQTKADQEKMSTSLHKMLEEDPTIKVKIDAELKQTIVSGMGEIQLNIFISNLKNKYNVNVETENPKVHYRETIKKKSSAQGKYKKQTGGRGQFGDCWIELEPLSMNNGGDFEFVDKIVGGAIPNKYIPAVEKGVKEALQKGLLAHFPVIKIKATVFDGSYHSVDSSDIAFQIAGSMAVKNAAEGAKPVLLEPIMKLKIFTPDDYMGDIMSDLNSRRGKILGMDEEAGVKVIRANVPEAELAKYINDLKSITQGSGTFEKEFSHYEQVPPDLSQKIITQRQKESEESKG
ncbi:MAG: elongation factor G [Spirochaetes bacterium]|nr:elongation factor G [Spirochaetota bacterium]